jgi:hypothetical protein
MSKPNFPSPRRINGRLYWERGEIEDYKRALLGLPPAERGPTLELVPASVLGRELGVGRRTLGRRIAGRPSEAGAESRTHRSTSERGEVA